MTSNAKGLSFVFIEPGNGMTEEEHYDWYDNEHSPARLTVSGFFTAIRYKAVDSQKPSYLTLYDISEPSVANGPDFQVLRERASVIDDPYLLPDRPTSSLPGKFILLAGAEVKPDIEDEFNKWYKEEYVKSLQRHPAWIRCRRYVLYDNLHKGELEGAGVLKICKFLAIHEFSEDGFMDSDVFKEMREVRWLRLSTSVPLIRG